ncbi:hypothetical protein FA15DRAFT_203849 [Coprinopsis marcescibilis]|uniref:Secreted protein n=1 Tax=Coprinopsis marcescibilis TaxID=230819 RepID=A0A5C3LNB7_COPMA|nr:hypothetical protein FA15DRAFT_203849 [Coprinopsis marcescibilis]
MCGTHLGIVILWTFTESRTQNDILVNPEHEDPWMIQRRLHFKTRLFVVWCDSRTSEMSTNQTRCCLSDMHKHQ